MDGTVLVAAGVRQVESLGMKCDSNGIPEALSGAKPDGWWLIEGCLFGGEVVQGSETGTVGEITEGKMNGTAALAVGEGRVFGILSGMNPEAEALWWSWPLSMVKVEAVGAQGMFKKRPVAIRLDRNGGADADGDTLAFKGVNRLWRNSGSAQARQEESLLKALQGLGG
jgi:hypothetical protein